MRKGNEMVKNINLGIGTGRRKCAIARVFLREGTGKIIINQKELKEYFPIEDLVAKVRKPFLVTDSENKLDRKSVV